MKKSRKRIKDNVISVIMFAWLLGLAVYWVHTCTENSKPARLYEPIKEQVVLPKTVPIKPTVVQVGYSIAESLQESCRASSEAIDAETEPSLYTEYERDLLMRIASAEAGNQGIEGMALVMLVVINRVLISGTSIETVIYAEGQFAALSSQQWAQGYYASGCDEALALVESGWDVSNGALYFCTHSHNSWHSKALTYLFTYKDHEFYK